MAMNSSGPISLGGATAGQSINLENGAAATAQVSLNDTAVRNLAGVPSGAIVMPTNFYGKSNIVNISYTFSTNTQNAVLNLSTLPGYSAGKTNFTVTINTGVYVYATSTASYGLNITGGTTGDTLVIVNNGYIHGKGGNGGASGGSGGTGGTAINLGFGMSSCTINNTYANAYIAGGGGGGQGIASTSSCAGGGAGGGDGGGQPAQNVQGGAGAYTGGTGATGKGSGTNTVPGGGGGGGSAFPGTGGAGAVPNAGNSGPGYGGSAGGGGGAQVGLKASGYAGTGGSGNSVGGNWSGTGGTTAGGGGGGWGAAGGQGNGLEGATAGQGGKAVNLNGKTVTWTSGNTTRVWGAVS